jgi:hypothetical protein
VHLAILLEKVQDGSLWGIILKVAAEDLQAQLSTAREKPFEYEDERATVRNVCTLSAARCGDYWNSRGAGRATLPVARAFPCHPWQIFLKIAELAQCLKNKSLLICLPLAVDEQTVFRLAENESHQSQIPADGVVS